MVDLILISDIKINRELAPGDDLKDLTASIIDLGVEAPVVLYQGELIDGLRRIRVVENLGLDRISAINATDFPGVTDALALSHTEPLTDYARMATLITFLMPLGRQWMHEDQRTKKTFSKPAVRPRISKALGGVSDSSYGKFATILKDPGANPDLIKRVLSGSITPSSAYRLYLMERSRSPILDADEQLQILDHVNHGLRTQLDLLNKLSGGADKTEEVQQKLELLRKSRRRLSYIIHRLEEATK